jgi:large subunit ribosomal protein L15
MKLHDFKPAAGSRKNPKRVGRGPGSGLGKTSGRGHKGQKSRSGYSRQRGFEGGQMPLHRRLPKRGFTNIFRIEYRTVNIERLAGFAAGTTVDPDAMTGAGVLRKGKDRVKVLGNGEIAVGLTVRAHHFTKSAVEKIEAAGGRVERIAVRQPYRRPRRR